jgi:pyrroline-5-carboxylate reductase
MISQTIGFIGAGQMARALGAGLVQHGVAASNIYAYDVSTEAVVVFLDDVPESNTAFSAAEIVKSSDVVVLAVKPQQLPGVLADMRSHVSPKNLIISIAAGVRLAQIGDQLLDPHNPQPLRLARVMPNTPCLVGQSASGYCLGDHATEKDARLIDKLLTAVGLAVRVEEKLLDAVTGLSGSGPAFVYVMIEALSDGGVRMGLPRDVALKLAAQTVRGAAEMVLATGDHPAVLKDRVASPGGTTIAGLQALEDGGFRSAIIAAVEAATNRSLELGT